MPFWKMIYETPVAIGTENINVNKITLISSRFLTKTTGSAFVFINSEPRSATSAAFRRLEFVRCHLQTLYVFVKRHSLLRVLSVILSFNRALKVQAW